MKTKHICCIVTCVIFSIKLLIAQPMSVNLPNSFKKALMDNVKSGKHWVINHQGKKKSYRKKGEILIYYKKQFKKRLKHAKFKYKSRTKRHDIMKFDEKRLSVKNVLNKFKMTADVLYVEPNIRLKSLGYSEIPKLNFNNFKRLQRHVRKFKLNYGKFRNRRRWKNTPIRIGILDTGIDYEHPDLKNNVGKGVNVLFEEDYSSENYGINQEPYDNTEMDYNGHGTKMAGIIGAEQNDIGIDGLCENVKIFGIKAFDKDGYGSLASVVSGIQWAIDNQMDILNMSFGTYEESDILAEAISEAKKAGLILVAAAGNDYIEDLMFPAKFREVISVGSHGSEISISRFSNWSKDIDIYAPGENITSTTINKQGYETSSGTSIACSYISGVLANGVSTGIEKNQLKKILKESVLNTKDKFNPSDSYYPRLNEDRFIGSIHNKRVSQMTVTNLSAEREIWHSVDEINISLTAKNSGNTFFPESYITFYTNSNNREIELGECQIPSMEINGRINLECPLNGNLPDEGDYWIMAKSLDANLNILNKKGIRVSILPEYKSRVKALSLNITHGDFRDKINRELKVVLWNAGNASISNLTILPCLKNAVQEGLKIVDEHIIGSVHPSFDLEPGQMKRLSIPLISDLPVKENSFTVYAKILEDGNEILRPERVYENGPNGEIGVSHAKAVHVYIVKQAIELLKKQGIYIQDLHDDETNYVGRFTENRDWDNRPESDEYLDFLENNPEANILHGAYDEDKFDMVYHYNVKDKYDSHYWIVDDPDTEDHGLPSFGRSHHSALSKIRAFMYGKNYNEHTSDSKLKFGALDHYKKGYKRAAWYMVGHIAHLLHDVTVPAHVDNENWHGAWGSAYETWMKKNHPFKGSSITALQTGGMINPYSYSTNDKLRFLAYTSAQVGNSFPWAATNGSQAGGNGNRKALGYGDHYDDYMDEVYSWINKLTSQVKNMPLNHPLIKIHLNKNEVRNNEDLHKWCKNGKSCEEDGVDQIGECEELSDCWDNNNHEDQDNTDHKGDDEDGDLTAIAIPTINYAIRATAGLFYMFAIETGQLKPFFVPAIITPLLLN